MKVVDMIDGMFIGTHVANKIINKKSNCYKKSHINVKKKIISHHKINTLNKKICIPQF